MEKKNTTPIYDVNYFISKFEKIPEEMWCTNSRNQGEQRCAYGWCYNSHKEAKESEWPDYPASLQEASLTNILSQLGKGVMAGGINNGIEKQYQQPTPKQRILAALYDIRGISKRNDITSELAKDSIPETLDVKISLPQNKC